MMAEIVRWGIIGPGRIAQKFAAALKLVPGAVLQAVASRDGQKARDFAATWQAAVSYNSYEALANDAAIDAVYIATPHTFHHAHVMLCLRNRKAVLCEKPMSIDYASTLALVNTARQENVFLMEAMWTRFLPSIEKAAELVKQGIIGELKYIRADFGFTTQFDAGSRLYDMKLGGGALLDIGVYPLFLALWLMGRPDGIACFSQLSVTGADQTTAALLQYNNGKMASIHSTITAQTPITAEISGTAGSILLERPWYKGSKLQLRKNDNITDVFDLPYGENGFEFQVKEVHTCIKERRTESNYMPLDFSLLMSEVAEKIYERAGIKYDLQP